MAARPASQIARIEREKQSALRRAAASRANGATSRGPRTQQGKARSSQNSFQHGFAARQMPSILPDEDPAERQTLTDSSYCYFCPQTSQDAALVNRIVEGLWLMKRITRLESQNLIQRAGQLADKHPASSHRLLAFALLRHNATSTNPAFNRHMTAASSIYRRALRELATLRKKLDTNPANPQPA